VRWNLPTTKMGGMWLSQFSKFDPVIAHGPLYQGEVLVVPIPFDWLHGDFLDLIESD